MAVVGGVTLLVALARRPPRAATAKRAELRGRPPLRAGPGQPGSDSTAAGSVLPPQTTAATRSPGSGR